MPTSKTIKPENQQVFEAALPLGTILRNGENEYTVEEVLGAGGFGITYRVSAVVMAGNVPITTNFAVKEFFMKGGERADDGRTVRYTKTMRQMAEESMNDFMVEAKRLNTLSGKSRHIVRVNEVFKENNTAYYVMQYLDGGELTEHIERDGAMTEAQAIAVIRPIAEAVILIHREHLLHLDIKPDNIVLMTSPRDRSQYPVLIDFGIAKHFTSSGKPTSTHSAKGASDGYAPIEQYASIDHFAPELDVYALGATLFTLLTGKIPKKAFDISEQDILSALPDTVSKRTRTAIVSAMKKLKEQRTPNVKAFLDSLEEEYALPVGTVLRSPLLEYRITGLREERPGFIVYNAVIHEKDNDADGQTDDNAQGLSTKTKVKTVKLNSRGKTPDVTSYIIYEAFEKRTCKRADDGSVIISSGASKPSTDRVGGELASYRSKIGQTNEQGLPLAEQFSLNNTSYLAALIVKKAPLSERMARNLSSAGAAIATSSSAFARKAAKPVLYAVIAIALGTGAYFGIKAITSGNDSDNGKSEEVIQSKPDSDSTETPSTETAEETVEQSETESETAQTEVKEETSSDAEKAAEAKRETEAKRQADAAAAAQAAEAKRKADAAAKAKADAEAKRKADAAAKAQADAEAKRKADAAAKAKADAEAKRKAEAAAKAQAEAEARRKAQAEAEARRKAQAEAEARRKASEAAAQAFDFE